jgi:hypothetical protein
MGSDSRRALWGKGLGWEISLCVECWQAFRIRCSGGENVCLRPLARPMGPGFGVGEGKWANLLMWELHHEIDTCLSLGPRRFEPNISSQSAAIPSPRSISAEALSALITMRPTLALRAFRPTARMMRPIPVSAAVLRDEPVKKIRDPANLLAVIEGGPGRYVTPIDARRALRQPRRSLLTISSQGHTVSQRLRKLKQMPAELYPLCTKRLTSSLLPPRQEHSVF